MHICKKNDRKFNFWSYFSAYGLHFAWRSATERTPSVAPEESPLWGICATHRMAQYIMGSPRTSRVSGESGDTSRPNVDAVNSQCDLVVEREVTQPYGYRVVSYRVGTTAYALWCYYINYVVVLSLRELPSKYIFLKYANITHSPPKKTLYTPQQSLVIR